MKDKDPIFSGSKEYLEKSFLEELSYKVWSTKGARFEGDKRLSRKHSTSNISLAILSAYLIIASLYSVYISNSKSNFQLISYFITALSILLLVLNQYESSQDYKLRAKNFHNCGLELSEIYNKIRIFKTLKKEPNDYEIKNFCENISQEYQNILAKYENHLNIDYKNFKIANLDYFKEITSFQKKLIELKTFWIIYGWYLLLIFLTPIIILILSLYS